MSKIIAAVLTFALAACAMATEPQSPSYQYQVGFEQGCTKAYAEAATTPRPSQRDAERYANDADYRGGWVTGHDTCILGNPMWLRPFYR
jgi:hypothetical protein